MFICHMATILSKYSILISRLDLCPDWPDKISYSIPGRGGGRETEIFVMSMSVCLSLSISTKLHLQSSPNFCVCRGLVVL